MVCLDHSLSPWSPGKGDTTSWQPQTLPSGIRNTGPMPSESYNDPPLRLFIPTRQNRSPFSTDYFHPAKRGNDGVENLDEDFSFLTGENSTIGGFLVSGDDAQVVLGSTRVDIGFPFTPDRLRSYVEVKTEKSLGSLGSADGPPV